MSDSEDDQPLGQRAQALKVTKPTENGSKATPRLPAKTAATPAVKKQGTKRVLSDDDDASSSESEDDMPLNKRKANGSTPGKATPKPAAKPGAKATPKQAAKPAGAKPAAKAGAKPASVAKRKPENGATPKAKKPRVAKESAPRKAKAAANADIKWTTLEHCGVLFPEEYKPHGVQMLYDGKPVELTPDQEEVATMFAVMKDTDYMTKPTFLKNYWEGFSQILGNNHVIKSLDKCDFTPIYNWHIAARDAKKEMTKEEKQKLKEEREAKEAKYKEAKVDGKVEQVGNFRVEPPGLFRGRGEHPKMGRIKSRVYPRDITINIGVDAPIPEHPYPGQKWKEVRHDQTVTWLAYWKDTVSPKDFKYVFLAATSSFKADSDLAKYEKARKLKSYIGDIRANYERDWSSKDIRKKQMAVAVYFLDKLALRAGHEKEDDEADTVGCCTLKVENVEALPLEEAEPGEPAPSKKIKFDFLGKDSVRYENTVEVADKVYDNIKQFLRLNSHGKPKQPGDQLFDTFDANDLNKELRNLMEGLSGKVFRTYNASITLDRLLSEMEPVTNTHINVDLKKADYDKANKEVAILCNHQRAVAKTHGLQVEKMQAKLDELEAELAKLQEELESAPKSKASSVESRIANKEKAIAKQKLTMVQKESLKTIALGTSKINYMDPRITVAWCMRTEVPIERLFNKSLLGKFHWALDVDMNFKF